MDDVDDGGTDIDSLITKKLLELYKLHQIEQLAKCTSDLSFSRKTNEISDLINSIAQDYNLEEQEAECRLVHGVIRISTRKYKSQTSKGYKSKDYKSQDALLKPNGRRDGTLPDSGNETMTFTFSTGEWVWSKCYITFQLHYMRSLPKSIPCDITMYLSTTMMSYF